MRRLFPLLGLLALASCESAPPVPPPPAGPVDLKVHAEAMIDVPVEISGNLHVPTQLKTSLAAELHADTLPQNPRRTEYTGNIHLLVTNLSGDHTFFSFDTDSSGQFDGEPMSSFEAFFTAIQHSIHTLEQTMPKGDETGQSAPATRASGFLRDMNVTPVSGDLQFNGGGIIINASVPSTRP